MLLLLLACSDTSLHVREKEVGDALPAVSVTPTRLDFWDVGAGDTVVLPFTVWSVGDAALRVEGVTLEGDGDFALVDGGDGFDLLPGESRDIEVAFTPLSPGEHVAQALVLSDDPDVPEVPVDLAGGGDVPSLVVTPETWDFGALPTGCDDAVVVTLQNVGTDDLSVYSWGFEGDGFSIVADREPPFELAPYAWTTATITFAPTVGGAAEGVFSVSSNDPRGVVEAVQSGEGVVSGSGADSFSSPVDPPADILFVVDQSGSMDDDSAVLGGAFTTFIDTVSALTNGWHLGVVTTDSGCMNGGVLDASTRDLAATFASAVLYGEDRDIVYDEALFQILDAALRETGAGGCNEGFLRAGAPLHVIFVSDEPERSTDIASAWTWDWYLARWGGYVASESLLTLSGVLDTEGCNEGAGGYAEAIAATGGESLSICTSAWAADVAALAGLSLAYAWTFELSAEPVPASIVVEVDGAERATGWTYDAGLNAIVLDGGLEPGSTIDVRYDLATECP